MSFGEKMGLASVLSVIGLIAVLAAINLGEAFQNLSYGLGTAGTVSLLAGFFLGKYTLTTR